MTAAPLFGLILAGGASTRMRSDKAALEYHGQSQLQWALELLSRFCATTFISVRPDQREETVRAAHPQIVDRQPGIGPIAGISAALLAQPQAAWLIFACDLPFVTEQTLQHLLEHRDPHKVATAYRSSHDGLPEPLCAIWEPAAREPVLAYIASGKHCPRKFLINAQVALLDLPHARALDNVNTRDEFDAAAAALRGARPDEASMTKSKARRTLRIQYYAILREQAGRSEETVDTCAATPTELYAELRSRHAFQLAPSQLRVALNCEFRDWQTSLQHGDTVVFIPPVAGG